jgi:DNA (cytosine-5)-methyltransferase 1
MSTKPQIILLDLFSGIGGFAKGLEDAGFEIAEHFFSEVDKHAIANYRYNFKKAEYVGSVTDVSRIAKRVGECVGEYPTARLFITFGSPCQDFSLAGKRSGMEGERSSLILCAIQLIERLRPHVYIWENVKGAYSSNAGADYWAIQKAFANLNGYGQEQQLVNTAWLLPQNRERIYAIGHLANRSRPGVFPFRKDDSVFDLTHQSRQRRSQTKHCSTIVRPGMGSKADDTFIDVPNKAGCLSAGGHSDMQTIQVKSATTKGYETATEGDSINLAQPNSETRRGRVGKGKAQTLETSCNQAVVTKDFGNRVIETIKNEVVAGAVRGRNPENPKSRKKGDPTEQMFEANENPDSANTLTTVQKDNLIMQLNPSTESNGNQPYQQNRVYDEKGHVPALCAQMSCGTRAVRTVEENKQLLKDTKTDRLHHRIRRLTENECERLQGFPDDWTKYGIFLDRPTKKDLLFREQNPKLWAYHTKAVTGDNVQLREISRTQRYKMCGNAVTKTMVQRIGERLITNSLIS